jgi:hypothetical protein
MGINYLFWYVHVGKPGRMSDGGVFLETSLYTALRNGLLNLPKTDTIPGRDVPMPYVFVADNTFLLTDKILKPFSVDLEKGSPKRVYNYRLSRARRIVENAFGLLRSVFRVFRVPIQLNTDTAEDVILACIHLHNFLRRSSESPQLYCPTGTFDSDVEGRLINGRWRREIVNDTGTGCLIKVGRNARREAKVTRESVMQYFMSDEGRVPWQDIYS